MNDIPLKLASRIPELIARALADDITAALPAGEKVIRQSC